MPTRSQLMQIINIQTEIAKLGLDLASVMQLIVEQTLRLIKADGAIVELVENDEMVYRAAAGTAKEQLGLKLKINASMSGLSVTTGQTLICTDSETDDRVDREACRRVGLRSMIVIPLKHINVNVGVLKAMACEPDFFLERDIKLLELLSDVVAASMYFSAKYKQDDLYFQATHDQMTGVANKALFMERLGNTLSYANRYNKTLGVLMLDMDGLKQINDTYGHRVGDAIIIEFANRLQQLARESDTVARLGGDEFGVVLTSVENMEGIKAFIQRIHTELDQSFSFEGKYYLLATSIGFSLIPEDGCELDKVLDLADQRMYDMKKIHHQNNTILRQLIS